MHRFYAETAPDPDGMLTLSAEDTEHALRVLRLQPGAQVELFCDGQRLLAEIRSTDRPVRLQIIQRLPTTEPRLRLTLFQGLPKADKMEWIIQKSVELGAAAIVPVSMERSIVHLNASDAARKRERWQKIAREACKQSGRCLIPTVEDVVSLGDAIRQFDQYDAVLVPWEEARKVSLSAFHEAHPSVTSMAIVIGPEGGISAKEIDLLSKARCVPVTLGSRILRTETAGLASISVLMCLYGEMEGGL